jgi:hypothetical protein
MIDIKFLVLGKEWTLRVLKKKRYKKKRGSDSVAITIMVKRRIDVHENGCSTETIVHELVHAYTYELCIASCSEITADDSEEFYAELVSKYGRELLELGDMIMAEIIRIAGIVKIEDAPPPPVGAPIVHYWSEQWIGKSPCGNKDKNVEVSEDEEFVTCDKCRAHLKKESN